MAIFGLSQKWNFPTNNYGQINGIADSGVETFKGTPIKSLAREICQNSLDAAIDNGAPVRIEFRTFTINPKTLPDYSALEDALKRALEFWGQQKSTKAKAFFQGALNAIHCSSIVCLRISDFNTTGLLGSHAEYNSPWCNLTKSSGASDKAGSRGGSFGIGKFAPYACSSLRTVFYSTNDYEGTCASQGVARLTSFKNRKNEITQGTGFYGNDRNTPAYKQFTLEPGYSRSSEQTGTDIFIAGFTGDAGWQKKMIASVLDGFLYSIFKGNLIVVVDGTVISCETLPHLIESHKEHFTEQADEYYQTLVHKDARTFTDTIGEDLETAGTLTLQLLIQPSYSRRAAMIRQTGMKIKDKGNISALIPFAGTLFIEGDAINSYLRNLENPQHLEWEIERADNKAKAKRVLSHLTQFIKKSLNEMKKDDGEEALDPSVGEYLSANDYEESSNQDRAEAIRDDINVINIKVSEAVPKPYGTEGDNSGNALVDDDTGDEIAADVPGEGGSGSQGNGGHGGDGGGANPGDGGGDVPIEHKKKLIPIPASNIRNVVRNKSTGEYTIVYTPNTSATNGVLELFMSAETQNYEAPIVGVYCADCPDAKFTKNRITGLTFTEKKPLRLNIQLDYHDYCSMEVKAYGNQI